MERMGHDMNTIEQEARVIAKKKTVLNDKIKFSTEADLRTAEYVCYKAAIEMADFIQRTILSPNGFAEAGGQFLKTSQTKENQQSAEQLLLKHAVIKSVCPRCGDEHTETDCGGYCTAACLQGY